MKLTVLIVDDMPLSRARLRRILDEDGEIDILGECADGYEALRAVEMHHPDLILLDIQMPGMNGLEVARALPTPAPAVVFVTAFPDFAVEAFAAAAIDYLVKPFDKPRLVQALTKVRAHLTPRPPTAEKTSYLDRIAIKSVGRVDYVDTAAIDWIETAGNYVSLHCAGDTHLVRQTMNRIEADLDPTSFVRIHRSTIVRIAAIRSVEPLFNGDRALTLKNGQKLTLSRTYRDKVRAVLGEI